MELERKSWLKQKSIWYQTKLIQIGKQKNNDTKCAQERNHIHLHFCFALEERWKERMILQLVAICLCVCARLCAQTQKMGTKHGSVERAIQKCLYIMRKISYSLFWYFTLKFFMCHSNTSGVPFHHKLFCGGFVPCLLLVCLTAYMAI